MKYRVLGKTGYRVSEIGLGCWQLGGDFGSLDDIHVKRILDEARNQHINFFDTADVYGGGLSEQRIAQWKLNNTKEIIVATKVGRSSQLYPDKYTKEAVRSDIEESLKRLQTDAIDLLQVHCLPFEQLKSGDMFNWLEDFKQEGLIKHYGASVETVEEAIFCVQNTNIATLQIIFNLFRQDFSEQLFPLAQQANVGIIVRLPLASGLLSGTMAKDKAFAEEDHRNYNRNGDAFHVGETFAGIPFEKGVDLSNELKSMIPTDISLGQLALRWILDHPAVSTVIAGASRAQQVAENAYSCNLPKVDPALRQLLYNFYIQNVRNHIRGKI